MSTWAPTGTPRRGYCSMPLVSKYARSERVYRRNRALGVLDEEARLSLAERVVDVLVVYRARLRRRRLEVLDVVREVGLIAGGRLAGVELVACSASREEKDRVAPERSKERWSAVTHSRGGTRHSAQPKTARYQRRHARYAAHERRERGQQAHVGSSWMDDGPRVSRYL